MKVVGIRKKKNKTLLIEKKRKKIGFDQSKRVIYLFSCNWKRVKKFRWESRGEKGGWVKSWKRTE